MSSDWTRKFITLMATEGKVPASHSRLFDELIYGKKVQSVSQLVPLHDIYVYINERNI